MESSVRGDPGEDPTKGVDSFLDGANMSLASFEPSLQIPQPSPDPLDSPSPTNKHLDLPAYESPTEFETRTPPLTVADLAAPGRNGKIPDNGPDSSPSHAKPLLIPEQPPSYENVPLNEPCPSK